MPSRNTVREYDVPAYYHVYSRGAGGARIFRDAQDKRKFLGLLERYLLDEPESAYPTYDVEVVAYCIMNNHFHLLLYQAENSAAITGLLRMVTTAYSMYYNMRYKNRGHVFPGVFRAARITNESYLAHITRYIHFNPETYRTYKWSSLSYYVDNKTCEWVHPERVIDISPPQYLEFLMDYTDRRALLKEIKDQLAS